MALYALEEDFGGQVALADGTSMAGVVEGVAKRNLLASILFQFLRTDLVRIELSREIRRKLTYIEPNGKFGHVGSREEALPDSE